MLLILTFNKDGATICRVESPERYPGKTIEELKAAAATQNEKAGYVRFEFVETPEEYDNIFNFFLGENKYKSYATFNSLLGDLDELKRRVDEATTAINDTFDELRCLREDVEKYAEEEISSLKSEE